MGGGEMPNYEPVDTPEIKQEELSRATELADKKMTLMSMTSEFSNDDPEGPFTGEYLKSILDFFADLSKSGKKELHNAMVQYIQRNYNKLPFESQPENISSDGEFLKLEFAGEVYHVPKEETTVSEETSPNFSRVFDGMLQQIDETSVVDFFTDPENYDNFLAIYENWETLSSVEQNQFKEVIGDYITVIDVENGLGEIDDTLAPDFKITKGTRDGNIGFFLLGTGVTYSDGYTLDGTLISAKKPLEMNQGSETHDENNEKSPHISQLENMRKDLGYIQRLSSTKGVDTMNFLAENWESFTESEKLYTKKNFLEQYAKSTENIGSLKIEDFDLTLEDGVFVYSKKMPGSDQIKRIIIGSYMERNNNPQMIISDIAEGTRDDLFVGKKLANFYAQIIAGNIDYANSDYNLLRKLGRIYELNVPTKEIWLRVDDGELFIIGDHNSGYRKIADV